MVPRMLRRPRGRLQPQSRRDFETVATLCPADVKEALWMSSIIWPTPAPRARHTLSNIAPAASRQDETSCSLGSPDAAPCRGAKL